MKHSSTKTIDLAKFAFIAKRLFPATRALAICDASGAILAQSSDTASACLAMLEEIVPDWTDDVDEIKRIDMAARGSVFVADVGLNRKSARCFVLWWIGDSGKPVPQEQVSETLRSIGSCIRTEVELQGELNRMAQELAERYEELNLVYTTDMEPGYLLDTRQALGQLVTNCREYMDADVAMVWLPGKHILRESHDGLTPEELHMIRSRLEKELYARLVEDSAAVFLNNVAEPEDSEFPFRIVAMPVYTFSANVDGIFIIANRLNHGPFTNSDKNLLGVMSRRAAKVVLANYDGLTGLHNLTAFIAAVESEHLSLTDENRVHCVMHVNIDKLHRVNETLGHDAGDFVIQQVCNCVKKTLDTNNLIARIGGDEIGVLVHDCDLDKGETIAVKLLDAIKQLTLKWEKELIEVTASVGIAALTNESKSANEVRKNAYIACDLVKEKGGRSIRIHGGGSDSTMRLREEGMQMVSKVHQALREDKFALYAQPIKPVDTAGTLHLEILLRMETDGDQLSPNAFLSSCERFHLMPEIDQWVLTESLRAIKQYLDTNPPVKPVFGINLSGQSFAKPEFLNATVETLLDSGVPGELICFEITETAAVANLRSAQNFIAAMRRRNCRFALDDFGAGLSSFAYLKSFDVDYLKIDGELVRRVAHDRVNAAMVESIHQIGRVMGIQTIAEFVESREVAERLAGMGIDYMQGFLLGKPKPLRERLDKLVERATEAARNPQTTLTNDE